MFGIFTKIVVSACEALANIMSTTGSALITSRLVVLVIALCKELFYPGLIINYELLKILMLNSH